jgi:hypothetical protein
VIFDRLQSWACPGSLQKPHQSRDKCRLSQPGVRRHLMISPVRAGISALMRCSKSRRSALVATSTSPWASLKAWAMGFACASETPRRPERLYELEGIEGHGGHRSLLLREIMRLASYQSSPISVSEVVALTGASQVEGEIDAAWWLSPQGFN